MTRKIIQLWATVSFILTWTDACKELDDALRNLRTRRVTLIFESLGGLSDRLVRSVVEEFPTVSVSPNYRSLRNNRSERLSLKIMIVEVSEQSDVVAELSSFLARFSDNYGKVARGQCIVLLVGRTERSGDLRAFFEFAWRLKFLDLMVIELTRDYCYAHQFDPFHQTYYKENLRRINFVDKLADLNDYPLTTTFFEDIPLVTIDRDYKGTDLWRTIQGLDVTITRALAETLRFKPVIEVINSDIEMFRRFNVTIGDSDEAIEAERVDFVINFYGMIGSQPLDDFHFEPCAFMLPLSNHVIVRQYGSYEAKVSVELIITIALVILLVVVFSTFTRLLKLDAKVWTIYNVAKILIGSTSLKCRGSLKPHEMIFLSCMMFISSIMSIQILEQMLNFYLYRESYPKLERLQDLLDSGIVPSITKDSKMFLASNNASGVLKRLLDISTTIESPELVADCVHDLVTGKLYGLALRDLKENLIV